MARHSAEGSNPPGRRERRADGRPHDGDVVPCPKCHKQTFEFNARWRVPGPHGDHVTAPAWVCDDSGCRFFHFAREADDLLNTSAAARELSRELRARARRQRMRARFVRQRAMRTLGRSLGRKKKHE